MKKTTAFLIIACLVLSVTTYAQQISFSKKNATIEDLKNVIEEKTGYTLVYQSQYSSLLKPVSIHITNGTLQQLLDEYFKYQAFTYSYIGTTIITIRPRETKTQGAKLVNIKGKISNEKGDPIPNATVTVNGIKQVITNENGEFTLNGVNNANLNIVITSVNYEPEEINLQGQEELDIRLKQHISELSRVSVYSTGYQKLTKEKTPGSFFKIDNELLNRRVSTNIIDRLEGIASGLVFNKNINPNVNQSSITIRTRSTIYANPNPLIIVDHFPYTGDINNINPNDVESITILKDADAAAIWGAYSGNGVIVITTKKGKYGAPLKVSFNSNVTLGQKPDLYYTPIVNSKDYVELEEYLFDKNFYTTIENNPGHPALSPAVEILIKKREGKISADEADAQLDALKNQDKRKDLEKYFYRNVVNQQYTVSATGGSYNNNYYFSAGYDKNLDNLVANQFNRITLTANNSFAMLKKKLEINTGIIYTETVLKNNNLGALPVNYPYLKLADDNGNPLPVNFDLRQSYKDTAGKAFLLDWNYRPLDELRLSDNNTNASDYRINADLKYSIIKGLDLTMFYQYNRGLSEQQDYKSLQTYFTRNLINQYTQFDSNGRTFRPIPLGGILDQVAKRYEANNTRAQLNYNYNWYNANHTKNHSIAAIAGSEVRSLKTHTETLRFYGYYKDHPNPDMNVNYNRFYRLYNNPLSPPRKIENKNKSNSTTDRYLSYYVNAKYIYQKKYILSASARKDESNLFGVEANKKGVPLWSVGASWDISEEKFYHVPWLPYMRVRVTNGYNGNVDRSVSAYTTAYINNQNSWGVPSGTILNPPNPLLRWEKNHTINIGADFSLKNNIIEGSLEYYLRKSTDLIGNSPLDPTTGTSTIRSNTADMKGKGVDITLRTKNINRQLKWNTIILFSYAADKVTNYKLKENAIWYYADPQYFYPLESRPVYSISGLKWMGLDPQNGDPQGYLDDHISKDYSKIYNSSNFDNLVYKGAANPTFFGSLRNVFNYKQFELSFNITWKMGYYFRRNSIRYYTLFSGFAGHSDYEKRWQNPGDENFTSVPSRIYPANQTRDDFYSFSEILVEKGDHIRLQDIQFSYDLLKDNHKKLPIQMIRFYVYANNIGPIWKANKKGIDPDYIFDTPQPRTVAAGIKINF